MAKPCLLYTSDAADMDNMEKILNKDSKKKPK